MRFQKICYHNYAQHRSLDVPITGSIIGLVGDNGSGKTNFINGMKDGVTGEFSRKPKDRLITRGQTEGSMKFEILLPDNRILDLYRELHSAKATLGVTGEETIKGASKVDARLLELLGIEKAILTNVLFVGQKDIESLLFARSGVKDRLAQRFFGIDTANQLESALAKKVSSVSFDSSDRRLPELAQRHRELVDKVAALQTTMLTWEKPWTQEALDAREREFHGISTLANKIGVHRVLSETVARLHAEIQRLQQTLDIEKANVAQVDPVQIDALYEAHRSWQQRNNQISWAEQTLAEAKRKFDQVGPAPCSREDVAALDALLAPIDETRSSKTHEKTQHSKILNSSLATPNCPTCGQPVDLTDRRKIEAALNQVSQDLQDLDARRQPIAATRSQKAKAHQDWQTKHDAASLGVETSQSALTRLGARATFDPNPDQFITLRGQYDQMVKNITDREASMVLLRTNLTANEQQLQAFGQNQLKGLDGEYLPVPDVTTLQKQIADQKALIGQWRNQEFAIAAEQKSLADLSAQIRDLQKVEKENRVMLRFQKTVVRLRELFHPDGAPRILVSRSTKRLETRINQYLALLEAPFRAAAKDGLDFDYLFQDGVATGEDLSVGQQIDMSWAFRLAANETFCASVGFMTMDEPTAALDTKTKARFNDLVERLKGMAATHGMQFFISTHDHELVRCCDQVIRFDNI